MSLIYEVQNSQAVKSIAELPGSRENFILEPKWNGFRLVAQVKADRVEFRTRSGKVHDGQLPHIEAELLANFGDGTILDGEIIAIKPGTAMEEDFEHVQSVMLSKPERSREVQRLTGRPLTYVVFDILAEDGGDWRHHPWSARRGQLEHLITKEKFQHIQLSEVFDCSQEIHDALVAAGLEGSIAKDVRKPYASGERGMGWYKIKHSPTIDCIIVGYKPGKGKYTGMVGAVHFGQICPEYSSPIGKKIREKGKKEQLHQFTFNGNTYMVMERGHCSGMDDKERQYMTDHMDELLGTAIEVQHMGIFPSGITLRHPQFTRFRPDKNAKECTWHDR